MNKTWIEISKDALAHNVRAFREHVGDAPIMAVVKSNAYGHGLINVAKVADESGAAWFGVDNVDEGIELRKNGIKKPILILGYTMNERLHDCVDNGLSFTIYNLETVSALRDRMSNVECRMSDKEALVHIKIETGTTRQGIAGDALSDLLYELKDIKGVVIQGASTHFANIEDTTDHSYADEQLQRFRDAISLMQEQGIDPEFKHAACSAATVLFPETYFNLVRLGISMYGLWSSKETLAVAKEKGRVLDLKPVMTWKTVVAQIKDVKKGTPISYGMTERVARDSKIAVLPVGYWDGYDRGLSGCGTVLIRGQRCKVMGRVCMNMCMVDVTDLSDVAVEDEVVLLGTQDGESVSAEELAEKLGTINYEVVTRINPLIPRISA
ncbi:MAG: alanine racemase [Patescibacteria group bacterium]|nr:alanine racemase [Patescibacteria group bacterium]MBU2509046.1 alanine racemase [Patescibacteria group bacterium]